MTREEIKNLRELVDLMLDKCVLADSRTKVFKRLKEVCDLAIKALEQKSCCDAISREEVLKKQYRIDDSATLSTRDVVNIEDIEDLPSVTPKEKTGYWIDKDIRGRIEPYCSVCGDSVDTIYHYNYCPNCGAKMVEPQESEGDKE